MQHHRKTAKEETNGNTLLGQDIDLVLAEEREQNTIRDGDKDDQSNRVKVIHNIVGQSVGPSQLGSLREKIIGKLDVADPVK